MLRLYTVITKRTLGCKRAILNCRAPKMTSSLFQKRNKIDTAHEPDFENVTQTVLDKFANAPAKSPARVIFDTLVASGRIKIISQTDGGEKDFTDQVDSAILPYVDVTKQQSLKMTIEPFPNACSDWKISQASQLAILDDRKYTFTPNLQVPPNTKEPIERIALHALRLKDKRFDELDCNTPNEWTKKVLNIIKHLNEDYIDDDLHRFFTYLHDSLQEANGENGVDRFAGVLLQLTGLDSGLLQARSKHRVKVIVSNQNGGYAPLIAIYDHAMMSQSYMMRVRDRSRLIAPKVNRLVAFVIEDKIAKRVHGIDGQLIAEMVVQAVHNYQIALNFESLISEREDPAHLIYPKDIREGKTFYSTAIRVTGYKVSIYRAEIPLQFIDAVLNGRENQPKADKFIIREVASPSGGPFNLLKIDELRALFDLLASFSINCQLPGDRPSLFVKPWLKKN